MIKAAIDLTIIIPNYNTRELLRNCLDSIYRYTEGIRFEIICVDGNSPDGSADMVAKEFPQVILVRKESNESYARSVNQGLQMARGRYACLLDSDTLLIENAFAPLVRFMDENPDVAVCGPKLLNPDGSVQHHIRSFATLGVFFLQTLNWHKLFPRSKVMNRYYNTDFDYSKAQPVESIGTSAYVMRRSTWETVGLLDERFRWAMPDLAYNYTLHQRGLKLYYTPCAAVVHFSGQTTRQDVRKALREQCQGLIDFSEAYDYFGKSRITKAIVRFGVRGRYYSKLLGYYLSSDKRVIKGPGAPRPEVAAEVKRVLAGGELQRSSDLKPRPKQVAPAQSASDATPFSD
ncbi:MAG TPA: glycosyltransferase family 2 protein [Terriglobales bacterium]|nr:glycosyltransferase family 2 protein [Terriglobales bacterium]